MSRLSAFFLFLFLVNLPGPGLAGQSAEKWSQPACLAAKAQGWDIAYHHAALHVVWALEEKIYWRMSLRDGEWTAPVVLAEGAVGFPDLVAGHDSLHLIWIKKLNIGYLAFDGAAWSPEEDALPNPVMVHGARLAAAGDRPLVFFTRYEFGLVPHTPGSYPLFATAKKKHGWTAPRTIPSASNVNNGLVSVIAVDETIHLAWVQEHRGFLFRNFGIGVGKRSKSLEYVSCDDSGAESGRPVRLGSLSKSITRLGDLAISGAGDLAAVWIDGSSDAAGVSLRIKKAGPRGKWAAEGLLPGDAKRRPYHAAVIGARNGLILLTNAERREESRKIEATLVDGNGRESLSLSPFDWLLEAPRLAVSPEGEVHLLSYRYKYGLCYVRFSP
ncbi:MAG: hypothetical protein V1816_20585 [Pseudomonadota bacterium]